MKDGGGNEWSYSTISAALCIPSTTSEKSQRSWARWLSSFSRHNLLTSTSSANIPQSKYGKYLDTISDLRIEPSPLRSPPQKTHDYRAFRRLLAIWLDNSKPLEEASWNAHQSSQVITIYWKENWWHLKWSTSVCRRDDIYLIGSTSQLFLAPRRAFVCNLTNLCRAYKQL